MEQSLPPLRGYQQKAVNTVLDQRRNTLVVLPTGSGKTRVASEIIAATGPPCIFLAPTNVLVDQQAEALMQTLSSQPNSRKFKVSKLTKLTKTSSGSLQWVGGRLQQQAQSDYPEIIDVLVSNPQMFLNEYKIEEALRNPQGVEAQFLAEKLFSKISLVIFDEVHHCLGQHPFSQIAKALRVFGASPTTTSENSTATPPTSTVSIAPQVVGLTAHPTYKKNPADISKATEKLFEDLRFDAFATATQEELVDDGFTPGWREGVADVQSYDLFDSTATVWRNPQPERRVSAFIEAGLGRKFDGFPAAPNSHRTLVDVIMQLEKMADPYNNGSCPAFVTDVANGATPTQSVSEWGETAKKQGATNNCFQAAADIPSVKLLVPLLEDWYEALRIAAVGGPDSILVATAYLEMRGAVNKTVEALIELSYQAVNDAEKSKISGLIHCVLGFGTEHVNLNGNRLQHLKRSIIRHAEKLRNATGQNGGDDRELGSTGSSSHQHISSTRPVPKEANNNQLRGIVFVDQSIVTEVLQWFIDNDPDLKKLDIHSSAVYSYNRPAAASFKMSRESQESRVAQFHAGIVTLLIATNVLEEGIDVAKANAVFRFDAVTNAVSYVQGGGRARAEEGKEIVLTEFYPNSTSKMDEAVVIGRNEATSFLNHRQSNAYFRHQQDILQSEITLQLAKIQSCGLDERHLPPPGACRPPLPFSGSAAVDGIGTASGETLQVEPSRVTMLGAMIDGCGGPTKTPLSYLTEQKGRKKERHLGMFWTDNVTPGEHGGSMVVTAQKNSENNRFKDAPVDEWSVTVQCRVSQDLVRKLNLRNTTPIQIYKHACIEVALMAKLGFDQWKAGSSQWK